MKVEFQDKEASINDMNDGDIALVISGQYKGKVVQRYGAHLVAIGKYCEKGHGYYFLEYHHDTVKILKSGDKIEL